MLVFALIYVGFPYLFAMMFFKKGKYLFLCSLGLRFLRHWRDNLKKTTLSSKILFLFFVTILVDF